MESILASPTEVLPAASPPSAGTQRAFHRYALVGYGNIGRKRQAVLGARCVATVDPLNHEARYRDIGEMPEGSFDAAILSVPNDVKLPLMRQLLAQGKHVLVEKPLVFASEADAAELRKVAEANNAIWYTAYNHRFEPLVQTLQSELGAGRLGQIYQARLFYGNGTVNNIKGTFRDQGLGVVEDLGSHLLDLSACLLGAANTDFSAANLQHHEATACDHALLTSPDGRIALEMSFLSWKNTFTIDIIGEFGSAHLRGLRKWGKAELSLRERVFPSGVPTETRLTSHGTDETWRDEIAHFEALVQSRESSFENDCWISRVLRDLGSSTQ